MHAAETTPQEHAIRLVFNFSRCQGIVLFPRLCLNCLSHLHCVVSWKNAIFFCVAPSAYIIFALCQCSLAVCSLFLLWGRKYFVSLAVHTPFWKGACPCQHSAFVLSSVKAFAIILCGAVQPVMQYLAFPAVCFIWQPSKVAVLYTGTLSLLLGPCLHWYCFLCRATLRICLGKFIQR